MAEAREADVRPRKRPLADAIVTLAETPDHVAGIDARFKQIARLAADRVGAADYASVTTLRGREYTIVAASSEVAIAVDEAQISDRVGPSLQALDTGEPVGVPDVAATMDWPGFHALAPTLGLQASVSVPLHMGRGAPGAVLNLYGRDDVAMQPLIFGVAQLYAVRHELTIGTTPAAPADPGAEELLGGYAEALAVRATIQLAITLLAAGRGSSPGDAYAHLCLRAAAAGTLLGEAATTVVEQHL
ncbi:GAF domain-containing protein [Actinoplanes siamensis]|uniref:GAF domain-containing protein n=1 Tax=Actinoplanes siamensis TaxID=1223317 RepID=A0A919KBT5_9ACTN|nr:GAF domain-containing protein [Actinoplanes siamensis]GIF02686.1 hypothetical protein Asi03nite_02240 [Actinoplanes siamensis]